eukprot:COSAG02_NODE_53235_length_303_cov_0.735294_1_plen_47_part_01
MAHAAHQLYCAKDSSYSTGMMLMHRMVLFSSPDCRKAYKKVPRRLIL